MAFSFVKAHARIDNSYPSENKALNGSFSLLDCFTTVAHSSRENSLLKFYNKSITTNNTLGDDTLQRYVDCFDYSG